MCTIALAFQTLDGLPVALGANRDERYDRPATPPRVYNGDPRTIAPVDAAAGGTWIGTNAAGITVAIANLSVPATGARSRGHLVRDALSATTHAHAIDRLRQAIRTGSYAGCAVLVVTQERASIVRWNGKLTIAALAPGIHVLTNAGHDAAVADATTIRSRLEAAEDWSRTLRVVLADHGLPVCHHGDAVGTRSSSIIRWTHDGQLTFLFCDAAPCTGEYQRYFAGCL